MAVRTVEVRDIVLGSPEASAAIGRIVFTGFIREGERVRAEKVEIESVKGRAGTVTIDIPKISLAGVDLPAEAFQALTGERAIENGLAAFVQASIDQFTIAQVTIRDTATPLLMTWNLSANGLKEGALSAARLADIQFEAGASTDADRVAASIGELRYQGVNIAELLRYGTGGTPGETKRLIQRSIADAIQVNVEGVKVTLDRLEISGLDGRALPLPFDLEAAVTQVETQGPSEEMMLQATAYAKELQRTLRLARYGFEGSR